MGKKSKATIDYLVKTFLRTTKYYDHIYRNVYFLNTNAFEVLLLFLQKLYAFVIQRGATTRSSLLQGIYS